MIIVRLSFYIRIIPALVLILLTAIFPVDSQASVDSEEMCMSCHKLIRKVEWNNSVHKLADIGCIDCHMEIDEVDPEVGHMVDLEPPSCEMCHDEQIFIEYEASIHGTSEKETPSCTVCHDPHKELPRNLWSREYVIGHCVKCHNVIDDPEVKHLDWLVERDLHVSALHCNICHSEVGGSMSHKILPKENAVRDCNLCHSEETVLRGKILTVGNRNRKSWKLFAVGNEKVLDAMGYVIGGTRMPFLDWVGGLMILGSIAFPIVHGGIRFLGRRKKQG